MTRLLLAAMLAAALAGCGNDGDADPPPPPERAAVIPTTTAETPVAGEEAPADVPATTGADGFDPQRIYERQAAGVVTVRSLFGGGSLADILSGGRGGGGVGSGFVVSAAGEIVTNAHVVTQGEGQAIERAREVYIEFADRNQVKAKVVGYDPFADIALLKVNPQGLALRTLELGTDESVRIGEPVAAIGSPFGQQQSLSVGIVSAKDRSIASLTQFAISGAVQTDAAINPGNSGGPLVDGDGRVIGVNQQIQSSSGGNEGVGFAVPVDVVKVSIEKLRREGRARYAYLGVSTQQLYPQLVERFDLPVDEGAWVQTVSPDGPADDAGLRGGGREQRFQLTPVRDGGDIITRVGETPIDGPDDLADVIAALRPGQRVPLEVRRGERSMRVTVTLGERPVGRAGARP